MKKPNFERIFNTGTELYRQFNAGPRCYYRIAEEGVRSGEAFSRRERKLCVQALVGRHGQRIPSRIAQALREGQGVEARR
jgi:hypothetical protein